MPPSLCLALQVENFEDILNCAEKKIYILEVGERIIGYTLLNLKPEHVGISQADDLPGLARCYLLAEFLGAGHAQKMVQASLRIVSGGISLLVNDENERAFKFYTRQGFNPVGETSFYVGKEKHRDLEMVNF